jgi:hypothetical protein
LDEIERLPMIMRPLYRTLDCGTRFDRLQRSWSAEQLFSAGINRVLQGDSGGGWCLMCRGVRLYPSLLWRPIRLMDYVLTPIGPLSRPVLGMLHSRRRAEMKARAV